MGELCEIGSGTSRGTSRTAYEFFFLQKSGDNPPTPHRWAQVLSILAVEVRLEHWSRFDSSTADEANPDSSTCESRAWPVLALASRAQASRARAIQAPRCEKTSPIQHQHLQAPPSPTFLALNSEFIGFLRPPLLGSQPWPSSCLGLLEPRGMRGLWGTAPWQLVL